MKIAIIGSGALATLFGAHLSPLADVTLIGSWQAQIEALNQRGVTLLRGDRSIQLPLRATNDAASVYPADVALVLVKSYQTIIAAERVSAALAAHGVCITLQNGLGNREMLAQYLPGRPVVAGVTTEAATLLGPGRLRHAARGMTVTGRAASPYLEPFHQLLKQAQFDSALADDVDALLWGKVAVNAAINPLALLLGQPNGALVQDTDVRRLLRAAAAEVEYVARMAGVSLPYQSAADEAVRVAQQTATNRASMLQDFERGAPTEIDAINGAVVRAAARWGVDAPINRWLRQQVVNAEKFGRVDQTQQVDEIRRFIRHVGAATADTRAA